MHFDSGKYDGIWILQHIVLSQLYTFPTAAAVLIDITQQGMWYSRFCFWLFLIHHVVLYITIAYIPLWSKSLTC